MKEKQNALFSAVSGRRHNLCALGWLSPGILVTWCELVRAVYVCNYRITSETLKYLNRAAHGSWGQAGRKVTSQLYLPLPPPSSRFAKVSGKEERAYSTKKLPEERFLHLVKNCPKGYLLILS